MVPPTDKSAGMVWAPRRQISRASGSVMGGDWEGEGMTLCHGCQKMPVILIHSCACCRQSYCRLVNNWACISAQTHETDHHEKTPLLTTFAENCHFGGVWDGSFGGGQVLANKSLTYNPPNIPPFSKPTKLDLDFIH